MKKRYLFLLLVLTFMSISIMSHAAGITYKLDKMYDNRDFSISGIGTERDIIIKNITVSKEETIVTIILKNRNLKGDMNMSAPGFNKSFIRDAKSAKMYQLINYSGMAIIPSKEYMSSNSEKEFILIFEPIPATMKIIHVYCELGNAWWGNVELK